MALRTHGPSASRNRSSPHCGNIVSGRNYLSRKVNAQMPFGTALHRAAPLKQRRNSSAIIARTSPLSPEALRSREDKVFHAHLSASTYAKIFAMCAKKLLPASGCTREAGLVPICGNTSKGVYLMSAADTIHGIRGGIPANMDRSPQLP